jgi:hypothetical protein
MAIDGSSVLTGSAAQRIREHFRTVVGFPIAEFPFCDIGPALALPDMQQQLRHVARQPMHVVTGLLKVAPRELVGLDEGEDLRVDRRTERLDPVTA